MCNNKDSLTIGCNAVTNPLVIPELEPAADGKMEQREPLMQLPHLNRAGETLT